MPGGGKKGKAVKWEWIEEWNDKGEKIGYWKEWRKMVDEDRGTHEWVFIDHDDSFEVLEEGGKKKKKESKKRKRKRRKKKKRSSSSSEESSDSSSSSVKMSAGAAASAASTKYTFKWGALHMTPVEQAKFKRERQEKDPKELKKKQEDQPPTCGMCMQEIHPRESICVPKHNALKDKGLEYLPGGRHGRVHSECAWPQLVLYQCAKHPRLREEVHEQLTAALEKAISLPWADTDYNIKINE